LVASERRRRIKAGKKSNSERDLLVKAPSRLNRTVSGRKKKRTEGEGKRGHLLLRKREILLGRYEEKYKTGFGAPMKKVSFL